MSTESGRRVGYIDILRAFGIILMIVGHAAKEPNRLTYYIQSFHMPLFFLISGVFYKKGTIVDILRKKSRSLLVPYILWGCVFLTAVCLFDKSIRWDKVSALFLFPTEHAPIASAMWFIVAIFVANILYLLIDYIPNKYLKTVVVVGCSLFGELCGRIFGVSLPFALGPAMTGVGLIHIGACASKHIDSLSGLKPYVWIPIGIAGVFAGLHGGYVSMRTDSYPNIWLFWIVAVGNSLVYLNLAKCFDRWIGDTRIGVWLKGIGKDSMFYVIFNEATIRAVSYGAEYIPCPEIIKQFIIAIFALLILYMGECIFRRFKIIPLDR